MNVSRSNLLALLVIVSAACAAMMFARMQTLRAGAIEAQQDLRDCRADLTRLAQVAPVAARGPLPSEADLERLLNDAAQASGTRLASIEGGSRPSDEESSQAATEKTVEASVFVRLDTLTLRQLVAFLGALSERDPAARAKVIELSIPQGSENPPPDAWAADVTIGYTSAAKK
jgi:hypothetical protein